MLVLFPTSRIHSIHPTTQILGDPTSAVQTRSKVYKSSGRLLLSMYIQKQRRNNHKDFQHCLFACFLSQIEPKKISQALEDESWVDAMQEELLQFKIQKAYQMDVKSAFLYGIIDKEVYVSQPPGFVDPKFLKKSGYRRGTIDKILFIKKDKNDIMLVQVYVDDIIFGSTKSTPIETQKPLTKDEEAADVDVLHILHLHAVKADLLDRVIWEQILTEINKQEVVNSLAEKLISWQYKKQTIVATSTTEAEYVAAANCCGQVLWIQNQMLDYGFNFMNTKIYIDNESTICIVKNPVFHSKTKHIKIRHHFIRDAYEKKLIQVLKIHTDDNVADLLTKAFDVNTGRTKLSTARPKLSTDSTKIESMKLEAIVEERRIFKCAVSLPHNTINLQFTMSNRHQELASPEAYGFCKELASPKQTTLGKDISNPLIVDSLLKTIWLSMHLVIAMMMYSLSKRPDGKENIKSVYGG
ncbi:hypothetical protein Tco_0605293 [Tanacetum coccineum]